MGLMLGCGLAVLSLALLVWPSPWADPRCVHRRAARRDNADRSVTESHGDLDGAEATGVVEVATTVQLIAIALRTGLPLHTALNVAVRRSPPALGADLWPVIAAYERGAGADVAWAGVPPVWQPVAAAVMVASSAGVAPGALLLAAARSVRRRESVVRESAIGRVSVRLVLPLGALLLPAFMCTTVIPLVLVMTRGFLTQ